MLQFHYSYGDDFAARLVKIMLLLVAQLKCRPPPCKKARGPPPYTVALIICLKKTPYPQGLRKKKTDGRASEASNPSPIAG